MNVHPMAAMFPMMVDEELQRLAADIAANGLLQPIILDAEGQLIDGRNRLAACKIAGIEPRVEALGKRDAVALILSANVNRRHLTKGQCAMAVAKAYPEPPSAEERGEKGGRGRKAPISNIGAFEFSDALLKKARFVLRHAPELVDQVMNGGSLNEAYDTAAERKKELDRIQAKYKAYQLMMEEIAALTPNEPKNVNLSPIDLTRTPDEFAAVLRTEKVRDQQQALLIEIKGIYTHLDTLVTSETVPELPDNAEFVSAIRCQVTQVIANAKKIAEKYNKTYDATKTPGPIGIASRRGTK